MERPVAWIDITASDAEGSRGFYADLFGWTFDVIKNMNYALFDAGSARLPGGIGQVGGGPHPVGVVTYFTVDDVDRALERVLGLGASAVVPRWDLPGLGAMAVIGASDGNRVGLWAPPTREAGACSADPADPPRSTRRGGRR